jgi:hypothetical protein
MSVTRTHAVAIVLLATILEAIPAHAVTLGYGLAGGVRRSQLVESQIYLHTNPARNAGTYGGALRLGLSERWAIETLVMTSEDQGSALEGFHDSFGKQLGLFPVQVRTKSISTMIVPSCEAFRHGRVALDLMAGTVVKKVTRSEATYTAFGAPYDDLSRSSGVVFSFVGGLGPSFALGPARLKVAGYYLAEFSTPYGSAGRGDIHNHVTAVIASLVVSP